MKKILTWVLLYLFLASATALAQEAVIIELDGDVQVQFNESSEWEKAAEGQALKRQSRVKTGDDGRAIIAFGEGRSNIINIDKNTNIVIEEVKPGAVFLPSGRVFSIIRELSQIENFEVKTPTAVAGARGTGWITEFSEGQTRIAVFEDDVTVAGLDENGLEVARFEITEEFAATVHSGGQSSDVEPVSPQEQEEWNKESKIMFEHIEAHDRSQRQGPAGGPMQPGPRPGPHDRMDDAKFLEYMKTTGDLTEEQLMELQRKMEEGYHELTEDEMRMLMDFMAERDDLSPEEEAMMQEVLANEEAILQMTPEERDAYFQELEAKYGIEGQYPDGGEHFDQYMDQYQTSTGQMVFDPTRGEYYYDPYYGSFDQHWSGEGGYYVDGEFHYYEDEFYQTIYDLPPGCVCPVDCSLTYEQCPPPPPPP